MAIISNGTTIISGGALQVAAGMTADVLLSVSSGFTAGTVIDLGGYKSAKLHLQWDGGNVAGQTMQPGIYFIDSNVNTGGTGGTVGTNGWSYYTRNGQSDNTLAITNYTFGTAPMYAGMNTSSNSGWLNLELNGIGTSSLSAYLQTKTDYFQLTNNHVFALWTSNTTNLRYLRIMSSGSTHYITKVKILGFK